MRTIAILISLLCTTLHAGPPRLDVGTHFPNIEFPALSGTGPLSIDDFRGQRIVLHIFASW